MSHSMISLIKLGSEENMLDLIDNGTIYMNSIQRFRTIEDNNLRGDDYEGVKNIWNLPSGQFEIPNLNFKGNYISLHLRETYENVFGNIYSLYCVSSHGFASPESFYVDKRVIDFGSHFVFIKNLPEFFTRMRYSLKLTGHKFHEGFVNYYDKEKINGRISIFKKPNEFEYQKEFRFYIERNEITPFSFKIGCLREIADIFPSNYITGLQLTRIK